MHNKTDFFRCLTVNWIFAFIEKRKMWIICHIDMIDELRGNFFFKPMIDKKVVFIHWPLSSSVGYANNENKNHV